MLTSSELVKDFGRIKYGKPVSCTFPVVNKGTSPLEITKIVVGCGSCTKAYAVKTKLGPGEDTGISVTFTPGSTGKQKKHVSIRYNADSILKLEFTAEVYA